ncbi:hypothetical protein AXF42_Ash002091 [Apostasia shenzhenica]|uniref:Uncharacterized protein n=1 Tax=Apostasia shenzhenica TaxID=1088818 RepID=A0A2I0AMI4_9ASPA|nr:hypothetical protein AXF42_Ash002091 [Apostasia shenzhenica]
MEDGLEEAHILQIFGSRGIEGWARELPLTWPKMGWPIMHNVHGWPAIMAAACEDRDRCRRVDLLGVVRHLAGCL